jgi:glycosyltransferase involved in cell wall biosynthesis
VSPPWLILREGDRRRWGGDLRRHYLLNGLAARTGGRVLEDRRPSILKANVGELAGPRWQIWRGRPLLASTELLSDKQMRAVGRLAHGAVVDIHDDTIRQNDALGIELSPEVDASIRATLAANLDRFDWLVVPSGPLADLMGLDRRRVIVASNGSDTDTVRPAPWPSEPAVAFVSGAAPRRGIEELIEGVRIVRGQVPGTRLDLWLAATEERSRAYLDALGASVAGESWIRIGRTPYEQLGQQLGRATVLCIPTPAHPYWDSVAPVKLFDYLAAGRPIVTTPRPETAAIVQANDTGLVTDADDPGALAAALAEILADPGRAQTLGANARVTAERDYDWRAIGDRLAGDILDRIG